MPPAGNSEGHGLDSRFLAALGIDCHAEPWGSVAYESSQGVWVMRLGVYMGLSGNIDRLKELKMERSQGWDKGGQRGGPETQAFSPSGEHCNLELCERSVTAVDTGVGNQCPEETRNTSGEDRQLDANRLGSFPLHLVPY